jgi:oxygen-independent coproporphyrinogen-3 oxidase
LGPGIYVHIPFCLSKCRYCAFNSYPVRDGVPEAYVGALLNDAVREASFWNGRRFESVYFGGGTPSLLSVDQMRRVMEGIRSCFRLSPNPEITVECNPNTLDRARLLAYYSLGVNRISIGVQSFSDRELRFLGRRHRAADGLRALKTARLAGVKSLSADLIAGIPGQGRQSLARSLKAVTRHVEHVSLYLLSVEPGTELEDSVSAGAVEMPDEVELLETYGFACDFLKSAGFLRYEISNWAKPGFECIHNAVYWTCGDYVGLGAGAHSHLSGRRYSKLVAPDGYILALRKGGDAVVMSENLDPMQMFLEELMLGLRTLRGVDPASAARRHGFDPRRLIRRVEDLCTGGYASKERNRMLLSAKGMMLHEAIVADLVAAADPSPQCLQSAKSPSRFP